MKNAIDEKDGIFEEKKRLKIDIGNNFYLLFCELKNFTKQLNKNKIQKLEKLEIDDFFKILSVNLLNKYM